MSLYDCEDAVAFLVFRCYNMNDSNISKFGGPASIGLSKAELWMQLLVFYLTIGGWASILGNAAIIVALVRHRNELHSRFFVIVAALSLTKGILACQTVVMTSYRIFRTLGYVSINQTRLNCLFIHFFMPPLFTVEILILIVLVIDRSLAIGATNYYRRLTVHQIAIICSVTILAGSIAKLAMAFGMGDDPLSKVIACVNVASPVNETYQVVNANIDLILVLFLLVSYLALMIGFRFSTSRASNETAKNALKRQRKVIVTMRNVVLLHCAFTLTAKILLTAGSSQLGDTGIRLMAYGGMITQCDEFSSVIALIWSHPKLKMICLNGLTKKAHLPKTTHQVKPVGIAGLIWNM